jgi:hypothetical protein
MHMIVQRMAEWPPILQTAPRPSVDTVVGLPACLLAEAPVEVPVEAGITDREPNSPSIPRGRPP